MKTLKSFSNKIEIYSIDEAFISLSHIEDKEIENYAKEIRERILKWTGIPTSVGVSSTKTLIKEKGVSHITSGSKNISDKINLTENPEITIWGVVTYVIHKQQ